MHQPDIPSPHTLLWTHSHPCLPHSLPPLPPPSFLCCSPGWQEDRSGLCGCLPSQLQRLRGNWPASDPEAWPPRSGWCGICIWTAVPFPFYREKCRGLLHEIGDGQQNLCYAPVQRQEASLPGYKNQQKIPGCFQGLAPDPETQEPCREPYGPSSCLRGDCLGLGEICTSAVPKGSKEPNFRETDKQEEGVKFPGVRERREGAKQFLKIKIFLSLELRMESNDQKSLVSRRRRVTPQSKARAEFT